MCSITRAPILIRRSRTVANSQPASGLVRGIAARTPCNAAATFECAFECWVDLQSRFELQQSTLTFTLALECESAVCICEREVRVQPDRNIMFRDSLIEADLGARRPDLDWCMR